MKKIPAAIYTIIIILTLSYGCDYFDNDDDVPDNVVRIRDNSFDPPVLTIDAGENVEWRQEGNSIHTVTSGSPTENPGTVFDSGSLNSGAAFTFSFSARGDYIYFCRIHGTSMTGLIQVR